MAVNFDATSHAYSIDGMKVPSVSAVLGAAGLKPDFSTVPPPILEAARRRGILVAEICDQIDKGFDPDVPPGLEPYADAYMLFLRETQYLVAGSEEIVWSMSPVPYAGRYDSRGDLRGHSIVDRKAVAEMHHTGTAIQCAGYAYAWNEQNPGDPITQIVGLHLTRDGIYSVHLYDFESCMRAWLAALEIYAFKRSHRAKKR